MVNTVISLSRELNLLTLEVKVDVWFLDKKIIKGQERNTMEIIHLNMHSLAGNLLFPCYELSSFFLFANTVSISVFSLFF